MFGLVYVRPLYEENYTLFNDDEIIKSIDLAVEEYIQLISEKFLLGILNNDLSKSSPELDYYWPLVCEMNLEGVDINDIITFIKKDIQSRFNNLRFMQFPKVSFTNTLEVKVFNKTIRLSRLNLMYKDFDSEEVKLLSKVAARIIINGISPDVLASVNGKDFKPASFREFVYECIDLIRKQHTGILSDYHFALSSLNFLLEHKQVFDWVRIHKMYHLGGLK
jgi:hypothetical protein